MMKTEGVCLQWEEPGRAGTVPRGTEEVLIQAGLKRKHEENGSRLFLGVSSARARGNGHQAERLEALPQHPKTLFLLRG